MTGRLLAAALLVGCYPADALHFRVTNEGTTEADRLQDFYVIVGPDKSWWPEIAPLETLSVVLLPDGERPDVFVSFKSHRMPVQWSGQELERGAGYSVAIAVHSDGAVSERHCRRPCSLP